MEGPHSRSVANRAEPESLPEASLSLPELDQARSAVLNSLPSKESQRVYQHAIYEFITWYCSAPRLSFNKAVVTRYRIHLESRQLALGTINGRLAAVGRLACEAFDSGLLSPDLAAGIRRVKVFVLVTGSPSTRQERCGRYLTRVPNAKLISAFVLTDIRYHSAPFLVTWPKDLTAEVTPHWPEVGSGKVQSTQGARGWIAHSRGHPGHGLI